MNSSLTKGGMTILKIFWALILTFDVSDITYSSSFNIVTYAQKTSVWKPQMAPCTKENRCEAQQWINSLSVGGSSNLLEGINVVL